MKALCSILFIAYSFMNTYGQNTMPGNNPHKNITNRIVSKLKTDGTSPVTIAMKTNDVKYRGYRLCEHQSSRLDTLNMFCTNDEIDSLFNCQNGSLKAAGFILYVRRFNNKDSAIKKFNSLLDQPFILFARNCSDAVTYSSIGEFCYQLISRKNVLFTPTFKLNKVDSIRIEHRLYWYERKILRESISYFGPADEYIGE